MPSERTSISVSQRSPWDRAWVVAVPALAIVLSATLQSGGRGQDVAVEPSAEVAPSSSSSTSSATSEAPAYQPVSGAAPGAVPLGAGRPGVPMVTPGAAAPGSPGAGSSGPASQKPGDKPGDKPDEKKNGPGAEAKPEDGKPGENKESGEKKEDDSGTVKRPIEPTQAPDPNELKIRPDEQGKVRFSFHGQPWPKVLQWLADVSGKSLDWQEAPAGFLNLTTQRAYTLEEARDLINRHLLARGFTMLQNGEVLSVVNLEKLNPAMVPRVRAEDLDSRDPYEFVKVSFELDSLLADEAAEELEPMKSRHGKLSPLSATNRLEAIDAVINLREIRRLLAEEQTERPERGVVRKFPLRYSGAEAVRTQLLAFLGQGEKKPATPMTPQQAQQAAQMQAQMQAQMAQQQKKAGKQAPKSSKKNGEVQLIALVRENSILAHAPPDKMAILEAAIHAIDVPIDGDHENGPGPFTRTYRLATMSPQVFVNILKETAGLKYDAQMHVDEENRSVVVYASLADHETIRTLIEEMDGTARKFTVLPLRQLRAEDVAETIQFLMLGEVNEPEESKSDRDRSIYDPFGMIFSGSSSRRRSSRNRDQGEDIDKFRVKADPKTNSLWLWATPRELERVEHLLDGLRREAPADNDQRTTEVHRLEEIDPEALVTTLKEMNKLHYSTQLQVDSTKKSIIAFARPRDQEIIRRLIKDLDGTGRRLEVISLRRLEADYVAGTISFLMVGEQDEGGVSREDRYNYFPYTDIMRPSPKEAKNQMRVDADVENNRLMLWVNDVELEKVKQLLSQLGEIPDQSDRTETLRILEIPGGEESEELLERIRRVWPSFRANPLLLDATTKSAPEETGAEATGRNAEREGDPSSPETTRPAPADGEQDPQTHSAPRARGVVRFAQLSQSEGENPTRRSARDEGQTPSPVTIARAPDGRLVIMSQDVAALNDLEDLLRRLSPPRKDYKIFKLTYASAVWVTWNLEDFFEEQEESDSKTPYRIYFDSPPPEKKKKLDRLSRRRPLRFISDIDTNSILVQGASPRQLQTVAELIQFYDVPEPVNSQKARVTKLYPIRYSKASVIAETVKDAYRDLLSANDKALAKGQQKEPQERQRADTGATYINFGEPGGRDEKKSERRTQVNFKGKLSIGVDDLTNTLLVSAEGEGLLRTVGKMIDDLDNAARPLSTFRVVQLKQGVSPSEVRRTLGRFLGAASPAGGAALPDAGNKPGATPDGATPPPGAPSLPATPPPTVQP